MTTYTLIDRNGDVVGRGLSAAAAANVLICDWIDSGPGGRDARTFDVVRLPEDDRPAGHWAGKRFAFGYRTSERGRTSDHLVDWQRASRVVASTEAAVWKDVLEAGTDNSGWQCITGIDVYTDEHADRLLAEWAADKAADDAFNEARG